MNPRILFEKRIHSQGSNRKISGTRLDTGNKESVSTAPEGHQEQESLPQRIKNQIEIDTQIASQLQAKDRQNFLAPQN